MHAHKNSFLLIVISPSQKNIISCYVLYRTIFKAIIYYDNHFQPSFQKSDNKT